MFCRKTAHDFSFCLLYFDIIRTEFYVYCKADNSQRNFKLLLNLRKRAMYGNLFLCRFIFYP